MIPKRHFEIYWPLLSYVEINNLFYFIAGEIIITNWKPLNIEAICHEDGSKTVGDIFRQISTVPTLKLTLR